MSAYPSRVFERSYPTRETARSVYDEQDLQRAVEAYRFFYPSVSAEGIFNGLRELGIDDGSAVAILEARPHHVVFTANSDTPYGSAILDLRVMGAVVIEVPAGPYIALVDDHHQGWVLDLGIPGPDAGNGGKYLVLPPGYDGEIPPGYFVGRSPTFKALVAMRAVPIAGDVAGALDALRRIKVYPLANPSRALPFVNVTARAMDGTPLRWEDNLEYWWRLHTILELEPALDELRPMYGVLAALGIQKGKRFAPDERMQRILVTAAKMGLEQMRIEGFASLRPDRMVWPDRQWEWLGLVPDDADFETKGFLDLQARDRWFVQAILASPAMFRRTTGGGSIYFLAARDEGGEYLDGSKSYAIRIPHPVPASLFWSVTAYDAKTRSQVQTAQDRAVLGSVEDELQAGANGEIELFFGPTSPGEGKPWIQTEPGKGFFLYLRLYGPEAAALDGSWKPSDVTRVADGEKRATRPATASSSTSIGTEVLSSIATPENVKSPLGMLSFPEGMPSDETAVKVYHHLDLTHGVQAFLGSFQLVSAYAIRKGLLDAGVGENDVLLFSELMDARSLFLTANCDTVYFWSIVDLSSGPMVIEMPPRVLAVLDDMRFQWIGDAGVPGPDRGEGGRYLLVPPAYGGPLPEGGFYVQRSVTDRALLLGRAFLENDDPRPAAARIEQQLKIYPYTPGAVGTSIGSFLRGKAPFARGTAPTETRFVEGSGRAMSTIPPNDISFFEMLHAAVQLLPTDALDPELAGPCAAIGIAKGEPFAPNARMKKILAEAIALANATARTLAVRPRDESFFYYGAGSSWTNPLFVGGHDFMDPPPLVTKDGIEPYPSAGARQLDARASFFYLATGITPAMCMRLPEIGSQYVGAFVDANGDPLDGARRYTLKLPPDIPAGLFWSVTLYDNQTRSMVQTEQRYPRAGSQAYPTPAAKASPDGTTTIHFAPRRPDEAPPGRWIQTMPGRAYFAILRLYSPLESFFDKSWRPGEIVPVK